jgi:signal transduction histidine kinase
LNARRLYFGAGASQIMVLSFEDITQRKSDEEQPAPQTTVAEGKHSDETETELRALTSKTLKAQEEERRRVSLELHDVLNQKIAMLEVGIQALEHKLPPAQKTTRKALEILRGHASELSNDVRRMAYQLHPSILDDLGLEVAMRSFATEFAKQEGVRVKFVPDRVPRSIPHDTALNLYRLLQEGLHNVAKHAHTERVMIGLVHKNGYLHLSIRDYGMGFDPEQVKGKGGLGLPGMQQRVRMINGAFEIHSTPKEGTVIDVKVPLPQEPSS